MFDKKKYWNRRKLGFRGQGDPNEGISMSPLPTSGLNRAQRRQKQRKIVLTPVKPNKSQSSPIGRVSPSNRGSEKSRATQKIVGDRS